MRRSVLISRVVLFSFFFSALLFLGAALFADEGMWAFHNPPLKKWKEQYGFVPTQQWLDHVRLASVRFNDGGSGSFVSPGGLVMTNHHVAMGQLQKISTKENDYVTHGFYAKTLAEEIKCADLEFSKIELEKFNKTSLRSNVVSLYEGGEYWLYRYKKYTDVRLVFAPEQQAAFFGGDPDNFTYPRYDLDMAFFRVYENDKPLKADHYFKWSAKGAAEGELVFVPGNPGGTDRHKIMAQLEYQRDVFLPLVLRLLKFRLAALVKFAEKGPEQMRRAKRMIYGYENSLKALTGEYKGLLDPKLMAKKAAAEKNFRRRVAARPDLQEEFGNAWDEIAGVQKKLAKVAHQRLFRSVRRTVIDRAITIVQLVAEVEKPNEIRLDQYRASNLDSLKFALFSPAPFYPDYEEMMLTAILTQSVEELGAGDPFLKKILSGKTPASRVSELIRGTGIGDPGFRKSLVEGGKEAVMKSKDPVIVLARELDDAVREMRKWYEENVESVETHGGTKLAEARFKVYGRSVSPDANFTLRLSYGVVKGYPQGTTLVPYKTTYYGLFDRAESFDHKFPFTLAPKVKAKKEAIDLSTPINFVCNADIIGGNSGSPVINKDAEIAGLIFDGNIQSLTANYIYDGDIHRAVSVHSIGIIEALRNIYDAGDLVSQLLGE